MRLYVSGATSTLKKMSQSCGDVLGFLAVPLGKNNPNEIRDIGLPIAADNGAFSGLDVWWCPSPCGGPTFNTREEAIDNFLAYCERVGPTVTAKIERMKKAKHQLELEVQRRADQT